MSRQVDVTFLGESVQGPLWQAQPQPLNSAFGPSQAATRAAFVEAWNTYTGESATEDDFEFVQQGGPPEPEWTNPDEQGGE